MDDLTHPDNHAVIVYTSLYSVLEAVLREKTEDNALPVSNIQAHNAKLALHMGAPMSVDIPWDRIVSLDYYDQTRQ